MADPGRAPILRTKSLTKKQTTKCMAEICGQDSIQGLPDEKPIS